MQSYPVCSIYKILIYNQKRLYQFHRLSRHDGLDGIANA